MILDLIFFGLIVVCAVLGFVFGFFKSLISFLGWSISILIAYLLAKVVANAFLGETMAHWLVGPNSIYGLVYKILPEKLEVLSLDMIRAQIAAGGNVEELIRSQTDGLMTFAASILQKALCKDMYLGSALQNARQVLALELTYHIYVIMVGVIIFLLIRVLTMVLTLLFKARIWRKVGLIERITGIAMGALRGFAYACILLMVASYLGGMSSTVKKQVDESKVSVPVTTWVSDMTGKILSGNLEDNEHYKLMIIEASSTEDKDENTV